MKILIDIVYQLILDQTGNKAVCTLLDASHRQHTSRIKRKSLTSPNQNMVLVHSPITMYGSVVSLHVC